MKSVKIADLKDQLSKHLRSVEQGAEVLVTDRDRPIARIVPVDPHGSALTIVPSRVPFSSLRTKSWPKARWSVSSSELLSEERDEA